MIHLVSSDSSGPGGLDGATLKNAAGRRYDAFPSNKSGLIYMLNVLMLGIGQCGNRIPDAVNREAFGGSSRLSKYYSRQKFPSRSRP